MDDTWYGRDLPVLRAAVKIWDTTRRPASAAAIAQAVGFDEETTQRALAALRREPFFDERGGLEAGDEIVFVGEPTGAALRVAGQWPTPENLLERLILALRTAGDDQTIGGSERLKFKEAAKFIESDLPASRVIQAFGGDTGRIVT
ncbi:hypothetical protein [Mycobacterium persicum]|uniref:Uncharacterized protein n=1 Tax=Mycobacterium persicum TaxID=1487726 RepID=A0AB38UWI6_9MYCO|nr:hypothetical protein [Mycobacterium persicum]ORB89759.1 hypothetical protein B1T49_11600 [Mycobacterium persicum]VAZ84901.1 hypothetical protein LAUMK42_03729 [Mycobacterium persicum]